MTNEQDESGITIDEFIALVVITFIMLAMILIPLSFTASTKYSNRESDHYLIHQHRHQHCELGHKFTHNHLNTHRHSNLEEFKYPKDFRFLWIKFTEFKYEQHHEVNNLDTCK